MFHCVYLEQYVAQTSPLVNFYHMLQILQRKEVCDTCFLKEQCGQFIHYEGLYVVLKCHKGFISVCSSSSRSNVILCDGIALI